jgi:hypothetical protein
MATKQRALPGPVKVVQPVTIRTTPGLAGAWPRATTWGERLGVPEAQAKSGIPQLAAPASIDDQIAALNDQIRALTTQEAGDTLGLQAFNKKALSFNPQATYPTREIEALAGAGKQQREAGAIAQGLMQLMGGGGLGAGIVAQATEQAAGLDEALKQRLFDKGLALFNQQYRQEMDRYKSDMDAYTSDREGVEAANRNQVSEYNARTGRRRMQIMGLEKAREPLEAEAKALADQRLVERRNAEAMKATKDKQARERQDQFFTRLPNLLASLATSPADAGRSGLSILAAEAEAMGMPRVAQLISQVKTGQLTPQAAAAQAQANREFEDRRRRHAETLAVQQGNLEISRKNLQIRLDNAKKGIQPTDRDRRQMRQDMLKVQSDIANTTSTIRTINGEIRKAKPEDAAALRTELKGYENLLKSQKAAYSDMEYEDKING